MSNIKDKKVNSKAIIHKGAIMDKRCCIEAFSQIYPEVEIKKNTTISPGTVI